MANASEFLGGLSVLSAVGQFFGYAVLALLAENVVFSRALGVTRLIKLIDDPDVKTWEFCTPVILVQTICTPLGWLAHTFFFPWFRTILPEWLPVAAFRPLVYLICAAVSMGIVWLLVGTSKRGNAYREQLPLAAFNCTVLGTMLVIANQNYTFVQSLGFGVGSGVGYLFAALCVEEGRRRLKSKDVPTIFKGLPSTLIYIGILSLAIYGLLGHTVTI